MLWTSSVRVNRKHEWKFTAEQKQSDESQVKLTDFVVLLRLSMQIVGQNVEQMKRKQFHSMIIFQP
jgi:hypothetical protein